VTNSIAVGIAVGTAVGAVVALSLASDIAAGFVEFVVRWRQASNNAWDTCR